MNAANASSPVAVHLGAGSNIGDKAANLREAVRRLQGAGEVVAVSHLYKTAPVGFEDQDWFLNAALCLKTALAPKEVLDFVLAIEQDLGRVRTFRNGPRTIDIDILLWGDAVIDVPGLVVPHPRLQERLFVLAPLREIAPDAMHPLSGATIEELFRQVADSGGVEKVGAFYEGAQGLKIEGLRK